MTIQKKSRAVERVFGHLGKEITALQGQTGIHCLSGCGQCCQRPDIEATILEFIPLAVDWYNQGKLESMLDEIERRQADSICINFAPFPNHLGGYCSEYDKRGLICRLFGYSARRDKNGQYLLVTCKKIKEAQAEIVARINSDLQSGKKIPVISQYYDQLKNIDYNLTDQMYPINQAIKKALEYVALYYFYRKPKAS